MKNLSLRPVLKICAVAGSSLLFLTGPASRAQAQAASPQATTPEVPDWALPSGPNHKQYPPPADFHRPSRTFDTPIGIFEGQSDIGGPLVPGSASFDKATGTYTINSAGYNIWYTRDEFRYLWKKMSGDISLAADVSFPVPQPPHDRKIVLVIRQSLDDDSQEAMSTEHGTGVVHIATRVEKNGLLKAMEFRIGGALLPSPVMPKRIGIEKRGDDFAIFVSVKGEPMHQFGPPVQLHLDGPFYVGIGFCSHYPVTVDTGVVSNVVLINKAGEVH